MKKAVLICVAVTDVDSDSLADHNKKYVMEQVSEDGWIAKAGRIGENETIYPREYLTDGTTYPMEGGKNSWDRKYREKTEKVRNGYIYEDKTDLYLVADSGDTEVTPIGDPLVSALINNLSKYAKSSVASNYTVLAKDVTRAQIDEAQSIIDEITSQFTNLPQDINIVGLTPINKMLIELYKVVPRRMGNVSDYLLKDYWHANTINDFIRKEQERLDVMSQQVSEAHHDIEQGQSLLDILGISVAKADDITRNEVLALVDDPSRIKNVYRVINHKTQKKFDDFLKTVNKNRMKRWHGSENKNWLSIVSDGLVIRRSYTNGRAFGNGLYFGSFFKSLMYTDSGRYSRGNSGYMALYDLNMGNMFKLDGRRDYWYNDFHNHSYRDGVQYHSLHAVAGGPVTYDEWIIYNQFGEQSTIYALVETY